MLREIPGPVGRLEALLDGPADNAALKAAVALGHPHPQYGGTMHTKALYQTAKALARIGCAVLRFNFRGVGASAGQYGDGVGEADDFKAALAFMHHRFPGTPLWAGGMSFGAWVGMTAGAEDERVSALIGVAPPTCRYDFGAVAVAPAAKFLIHGERDEVCSLNSVREFYARAREPKELVVIDAADHLFDGKTTEVGDAIEDLLGDWSA